MFMYFVNHKNKHSPVTKKTYQDFLLDGEMESGGIMCEGEWSSFNGTSNKEADFMAQLFSNYSFPSEQNEVSNFGLPSSFWHCHDSNAMNVSVEGNESSYYCSDTFISNAQQFPQGSSYSSDSSFYIPTSGHEEYYLNESNPTSMTSNSMTMDYCMVGEQNTKTFTDNLMEEAVCVNEGMNNGTMGVTGGSLAESPVLKSNKLQHKRKIEMPERHSAFEEKVEPNLSENVKKCSRVSDVPKSKKNALSKKKQKLANASVDEEETNAGLNGQTSSSYSSEDDSNASQELNGGTTSCSKGSGSLNLSGKARASRGSATDPQSLYARKRRERINERLRILQNLVPNGTKVDISTMLEEAVQYVKFLQIQIKLLSSDDMWMYAPIAYNGMNIGLNLNIPPSQ